MSAVPMTRQKSGFTLLEVMVALVLTSVVAMIAYGAAQVSFDTRERLNAELRTVQGARVFQELLRDALRNAQVPMHLGDTTFTLGDERLSFVASGVGPPLDADLDWRITVYPGSGGLALDAIPLGSAPAAPVALLAAGVTRWDVQVLASGGATWLREWRVMPAIPAQVAVRLWRDSLSLGPPIRVVLARGQAFYGRDTSSAP